MHVHFDIETVSGDQLFNLPPEEFFRIGGWKTAGDSEVHVTTDLEELRAVLRSADLVSGHNITAFDMRAVFGFRSDEPLQMTMDRRVRDTFVHAALVHPAPAKYVNRHGKQASGENPGQMMKFYSLDEQAYQLGVVRKTDDLKALAFEFGDPDLVGKARINDGFGKIPLDDPRYIAYLIGDVNATEAVDSALLKLGPMNDYAWREQEIAARAAVISSNGFRVDRRKAQARVNELAQRRDFIMTDLQVNYAMPTEGLAPWDTIPGKVAIMAALADHGVTPESVDWPKTPVWEKRHLKVMEAKKKADALDEKVTGWLEEVKAGELPDRSLQARERWIAKAHAEAIELRENPLPPGFGLSFGGSELIALTEGTGAEDLGRALAELKGQRSLAQLALDSMHGDGMAHPEITMLQRSGRWSTTRPGLTVWTSRGDNAVEKEYFIPDDTDECLVAFDYSNADSRVVAAYSGDKKYAERFEPGADGHLINAWAAWGRDLVGTNPKDPVTKGYRDKAKALGHGWNYGGQYRTLALQAGLPLEDSKQFCEGMAAEYERLMRWQNSVRKKAQVGYVVNHWGRKMVVEKGREFTQAPALMGQSGTREIMCDALLAMPIWMLRRVKAQIHDELILSLPRKTVAKWVPSITAVMETSFNPGRGGQKIDFPVSAGDPAENWFEATH